MSRVISHHDGIGNSMVDLMTSLAVIFILLLVAYLNKVVYEKATAKRVITSLLSGTKAKRDELESILKARGVEAVPDANDPLLLTVRIGAEKLQFDTGETVLKPQGKIFLKEFASSGLSSIMGNYAHLQSVLIEGHTDSVGNDEMNLRLSQGRSYAVLLFVINECGLPTDERMRLLKLISASGRGESDLIFKPDGTEDKDLSRRVSVKIRLKSIEQQKMPELQRFIDDKNLE
jgi:outer membrane protein OmpA-like peptidoglycan-associated protein